MFAARTLPGELRGDRRDSSFQRGDIAAVFDCFRRQIRKRREVERQIELFDERQIDDV